MKKLFSLTLILYGILTSFCMNQGIGSSSTNTISHSEILLQDKTTSVQVRKFNIGKNVIVINNINENEFKVLPMNFERIKFYPFSEKTGILEAKEKDFYRFIFINLQNTQNPLAIPDLKFQEVKTICFTSENGGLVWVKHQYKWQLLYINIKESLANLMTETAKDIKDVGEMMSYKNKIITYLKKGDSYQLACIELENSNEYTLAPYPIKNAKVSKIGKILLSPEGKGITWIQIGKNEYKLILIDLENELNPIKLLDKKFTNIKKYDFENIRKNTVIVSVINQEKIEIKL